VSYFDFKLVSLILFVSSVLFLMSSVRIPGYRDTTPQDDRDAWLFDYIVAFLKSPPWTVPLNSFIDENCIIFDNEDENKFIHTDCHERFKSLIEDLLTKNLHEIGVSDEEFVSACSRGQSSSHELNKLIFGQILAVDDFLTFKKMMYKRNMELEVEAMKSIEDFHPSNEEEAELQLELALALSTGDQANMRKGKKLENEEEVQAALRASIVEQERLQAEFKREQAELEHAIALSLALEAERLRQTEEELERQKEEEKIAEENTRIENKKNQNKITEKTKQTNASENENEKIPEVTMNEENQPIVRQLTSQSAQLASQQEQTPATQAKSSPAKSEPVQSSSSVSSALPPVKSASSTASSKPVSSLPPIVHKSSPAVSAVDPEEFERMKANHDRLLAQANKVFKQNEAAQKQREAAEVQTLKKAGHLTEDELKRRAEFMRAQREILLKKKNAERDAELKAFEGETQEKTKEIIKASEDNEEEARRKAMREALANRLKSDMDAIEAKRAMESAINKYSSIEEQIRAAEKQREDKVAKQAGEQAALAKQEQERQARLKALFSAK
jgi:hypothetical protein